MTALRNKLKGLLSKEEEKRNLVHALLRQATNLAMNEQF